MKIKELVSFLFLSLASFTLILAHASAAETIDLSGEWDATFIRMGEAVGTIFDAEEDVVKIIQKGDEIIGTCMIGGKRIGKNEEAFKGKLLGGKLEETFLSYPIHPVTFKLDWFKCRTDISDDGNLILMYSFIKSDLIHRTVVLKRRK